MYVTECLGYCVLFRLLCESVRGCGCGCGCVSGCSVGMWVCGDAGVWAQISYLSGYVGTPMYWPRSRNINNTNTSNCARNVFRHLVRVMVWVRLKVRLRVRVKFRVRVRVAT